MIVSNQQGLDEQREAQEEAAPEEIEEFDPQGAHDGYGMVGSLERRRWYRQRRNDL